MINLCYGDIYKDIVPEKMYGWHAGYIDAGIFYPAGSVSLYYYNIYKETRDKKKNKKTNVYFILDSNNNAVKIGLADDVQKRIGSLQTGNPNKLEIIGVLQNVERQIEKELHQKFICHHILNEWFTFSKDIEEYIKWNTR